MATKGSLGGAYTGIRYVGDSYRLRHATLAPEEVLFQRAGAPQRYAEKDVYFSREAAAVTEDNRGLLPDSDLLKAVHAYAAHFFEAVGHRRERVDGSYPYDKQDRDPTCFVGSRHIDERSMDETALIAFGILLEEAGRELLGRRGDLVFTEGVDDEDPAEPVQSPDNFGPEHQHKNSRPREVSVGPNDGELFWKRNYNRTKNKRRKMNDGGVSEG